MKRIARWFGGVVALLVFIMCLLYVCAAAVMQ